MLRLVGIIGIYVVNIVSMLFTMMFNNLVYNIEKQSTIELCCNTIKTMIAYNEVISQERI
jgi:hypothetical protein